jgi:hypothetical protein
MPSAPLGAQTDAPAQPPDHQHMQMDAPAANRWQLMQDGVVHALFNHQAGSRGGDEFVAPNWWMGMAARGLGASQLTLSAMFSLDPATVGTSGYRELFQTGEVVDGEPLVDRQHPHDLFMQLAGTWRLPLSARAALTLAGGPAGEATLGPTAFMHRPSVAGIPFAPLSHHTFDSTHISFGVAASSFDYGRWTIEGSAFNGREPDERRWDFDFAKMDSVAGRVWFRPTPTWELQVSTGHLVEPEALEPGDIDRTTASVSWFRPGGAAFGALTIAYGINRTDEGHQHAFIGEFARRVGVPLLSVRTEVLQVEQHVLLHGTHATAETDASDFMASFTIGGTREIARFRGFEGAVGANVTVSGIPAALQAAYGRFPVSFQVFFELRPPAGTAGRMWNARMTRPMAGHSGH